MISNSDEVTVLSIQKLYLMTEARVVDDTPLVHYQHLQYSGFPPQQTEWSRTDKSQDVSWGGLWIPATWGPVSFVPTILRWG